MRCKACDEILHTNEDPEMCHACLLTIQDDFEVPSGNLPASTTEDADGESENDQV